MERRTKQYILVDADDCIAPHGLDLEGEHDAKKVAFLKEAFENNGFDPNEPALVGYPLNGKIQLLSGTHRHLAAKLAGIQLPVVIHLRSWVEQTWGTELWEETIKDILVKNLECAVVKEGFVNTPYDRVDLSELY